MVYRFEILMLMNVKIVVFSDVTLCSSLARRQSGTARNTEPCYSLCRKETDLSCLVCLIQSSRDLWKMFRVAML
jgi:hypothetical protein